MGQGHDYWIVDAFSAVPLLGNPVAVFFQADDLSSSTMQKIAMEMRLSEVTFLLQPRLGGSATVRIFTPVNELPFAGHPLIGTARAYLDLAGTATATFETRKGLIKVWRGRNRSDPSMISMHQPVPIASEFHDAQRVLSALKLDGTSTPQILYNNGPRHLVVHVESLSVLQHLQPDHQALALLEDMAINCFAIQDGVIFSRMFSPAYGVVEDAGTGSAAGPLAIHCRRYGLIPADVDTIVEQGHALGKRCVMSVHLECSPKQIREVIVSGQTAVVGAGRIFV